MCRRSLGGAPRDPRAQSGGPGAVLKLDRGGGLGNALLDLEQASRDLHAAVELEDEELTVEQYLAALDDEGGIVEERIEGEVFRSPSVQLRMSPAGQVDVMSTHDQVLGGLHGHTYFGCHFPADAAYAERIAAESLKVGRRLAREGVIGRAAIDFAAVEDGEAGWRPYALEINLRCGGTTHPLFALTTLTDGAYDPLAAEYRTRYGDIKHYAATDHLDSAYRSLTPDDLLDVVAERGLGWDSERDRCRPAHGQRDRGRRPNRSHRHRRHPRRGASPVPRCQGGRRRSRGRIVALLTHRAAMTFRGQSLERVPAGGLEPPTPGLGNLCSIP